MINNDELIYKLEIVIEYLKNNGGYDYKLYNHLCPDMGVDMIINYIIIYVQIWENLILISLNMQKMFYT